MEIVDSMDFRTLGFIHGVVAVFFTPFLVRVYSLSDLTQPGKAFPKILFALFMSLLPLGTLLVLLSFRGYSQFEYLGVLLFIIGMAPVIRVLKNQDQVNNSTRLLGYTEIAIAIVLIAVGIIGYGQSSWFSIIYLVGSWAGTPIWTGLLRLLILFTVCLIVARFIK